MYPDKLRGQFMRNFSFFLIIIALMLLLTNSCSDNNNATEPNFEDFRIPFGQVNAWTYERTYSDTNGLDKDTIDIFVEDVLQLNDTTVYALTHYFGERDSDRLLHLQNDEGYFIGVEEEEEWTKILSYPIKDGYTEVIEDYHKFEWGEIDTNYQYKEIDTARLVLKISTDQQIDVNGKTRKCLMSHMYYETIDNEILPVWYYKFYFTKNTGLVKLVGNLDRSNPSDFLTLELLNYGVLE